MTRAIRSPFKTTRQGVSLPDKLASGSSPTIIRSRERACLSCGAAFVSAGPGERVCPECKRKSGWRSGSGK